MKESTHPRGELCALYDLPIKLAIIKLNFKKTFPSFCYVLYFLVYLYIENNVYLFNSSYFLPKTKKNKKEEGKKRQT